MMFRWVALLLLLNFVAAAEPASVRLGAPFSSGTPTAAAVEQLRDHLNQFGEGLFAVELDRSSGRPDDVQLRKVDIAVVPLTEFGELMGATQTGLFDLPFFFDSLEELASVQHGLPGEVVLGAASNKEVVTLGYWNLGLTQILARGVVEKPADLKGLRLGTRLSPYVASTIDALGILPEPISAADVRKRFEAGALDAVEMLPSSIVDAKLVDRNWTISRINYRPLVYLVVVTDERWRQLSVRAQEKLIEQVRTVGSHVSESAHRRESAALDYLSSTGMKLVGDSSQFREAARASWAAAKVDDELIYIASATLEDQRSGRTVPQRRGEPFLGDRTKVLFATDRSDEGGSDPRVRFGSKRGDLQFGAALLEHNDDRPIGHPGSDTSLKSVSLLSESGFRGALEEALNKAERRDILVYVHGYRNTFATALATGASVANDIKFSGVPIVFSWPSDGAALRYFADEEAARTSADMFSSFMAVLNSSAGGTKVHVMAHSMGSRLLTEHWSPHRVGLQNGPLINIVFAAPDVDLLLFDRSARRFRHASRRVTLYVSKADGALLCSRLLHKHPRVGLAVDPIAVIPGIDTVDASNVERTPGWSSKLTCTGGHSYVTANPAVLSDLNALLLHERPPRERIRLRPRYQGALVYWEFQLSSETR